MSSITLARRNRSLPRYKKDNLSKELRKQNKGERYLDEKEKKELVFVFIEFSIQNFGEFRQTFFLATDKNVTKGDSFKPESAINANPAALIV